MARLLVLLILLMGSCGRIFGDPMPPIGFDLATGPGLALSFSSYYITSLWYDWRYYLGKISNLQKLSLISGPKRAFILQHETLSALPGFTTSWEVHDALNVDGSNIRKSPVQVLNMPGYGNWSNEGWQLRFRGYVYKKSNIPSWQLKNLANSLFFRIPYGKLSETQRSHLFAMARAIFVNPQSGVRLSFNLSLAGPYQQDINDDDPRSLAYKGERFFAPHRTNTYGDYDFFHRIGGQQQNLLKSGDLTDQVQEVSIQVNDARSVGITSYLVPPLGFTIVSDVDDVLRVSKVFHPVEGIENLLLKPFHSWMNMADVFAKWSTNLVNPHFHYLTTAPEQLAQSYMDFVNSNYPLGSFDTRIVDFRDMKATLSIRRVLLERILETYPRRNFILVGDTSNFDIMKHYPSLAVKYPDQVRCILLRNVSATDAGYRFPYNTKWFKGLDKSRYMFFRIPDDIANIDLRNGRCRNSSVPQNVTFGWQGYLLRS